MCSHLLKTLTFSEQWNSGVNVSDGAWTGKTNKKINFDMYEDTYSIRHYCMQKLQVQMEKIKLGHVTKHTKIQDNISQSVEKTGSGFY